MIRAFVAIELPYDVRRRLGELMEPLRKLELHGRFVKPESIHLTLKFLGNVESEALTSIGTALLESREGVNPFQLQIRGLGVFPTRGRPRVVWVGVRSDPSLVRLQCQVEKCLEPLGFEPEKRPFSPHLTLVRLKSPKNTKALVEYVEGEGAQQKAGTLHVDEFHLYQSILQPQGAEYRKLITITFGPWPDPLDIPRLEAP